MELETNNNKFHDSKTSKISHKKEKDLKFYSVPKRPDSPRPSTRSKSDSCEPNCEPNCEPSVLDDISHGIVVEFEDLTLEEKSKVRFLAKLRRCLRLGLHKNSEYTKLHRNETENKLKTKRKQSDEFPSKALNVTAEEIYSPERDWKRICTDCDYMYDLCLKPRSRRMAVCEESEEERKNLAKMLKVHIQLKRLSEYGIL